MLMRQSYFLEKLVSLVKLVTSESGNRKKKVGLDFLLPECLFYNT